MQHKKCRRLSALELTLRIGAMLLSLALIIGLLPLAALAEDSDSAKFQKTIEPGVPQKYSDDMANPYGYAKGQKFLMAEQSELWLYYSLDWNAHKDQKYTKWFDNFQPFDGRSNTSLSNDNQSTFDQEGNFSGATQAFNYVAAVGFDPNGTGRKDHVAYVGYENGLQTVEGTEKYIGYVLWVMDTKSGNQYGPWKVSTGSCDWLKKNRADLYAGSNFFNIIAGDFDGNGRDDLVISVVDDNQTFGLSQYRFENGSLRAIMTGNKDLLHPSANDSAGKGNEAKDKLSMDFAVGDFNGDGIDDFAVVSYLNYGSKLNKTDRGMETGLPYLSVSYGASGSGSIAGAKKESLYICHDTNKSMYCSTITAGDINNDGKDELLAAGYSGTAAISASKLTFGSDNNERLLYASFTSTDGSLSAIEYTELSMNTWTKTDNGRLDPVGAKLMIEAVAINGKANPESVFISGDMYTYSAQSNKLDTSSRATMSYFQSSDKNTPGGSVGKSFIASVAVGDFLGNYGSKEGCEQVAYVVGLQRSDSGHKYSFSVHIAGASLLDAGTEVTKTYYTVTGSYIFYDQSFDLDKRPNCVIAAVDRDEDGILASYAGSAYAWSDPQVRAVMQASPYFSELNDGDNGAEYLYDSPTTAYSVTETYSYETSSSNSVSFGMGFAGSVEGGAVSADLKLGLAFDWTETFTKSLETEITDTFEAGAYDAVVICRTPVFLYNYDVTYLDEYGDRVNGTLQLSVPKAPVYESLTIDDYNEFVTYYNKLIDESSGDAEAKLQPLADNLYLGNEGNPFGYYRDDVSGELPSLNRYGMLKNLTTSGGSNSVEYSITKAESEEVEIAHGFSFELSVMGGFGIGGASAKAGGYVSLDYMHGHSVSKSHGEGTTFGGTVMGLDGKAMQADGLDPNAWGFNWQLATWDSNLKDNTENSKGYVPVIGYVLSGVQAPPMPVENSKAQLTRTAESDELYFDLSWDCGDVDGSGRTKTAGYRVYLYDIAEDTYKLVTTINDPQTTTYRYQNTFDGREYYHFMITAFSEATATAKSLQSVPRYATYYMSTAEGSILKIEKTGTDGLVDTYTIYFVDGTTQTFTVTNGNGIVSVTLLSSDPEAGTDTYQITFADGTNTTFTVKNGEKGEQGETGEAGVGIDRIEKLRSEGSTDIYAVYLTDGTFYTFTVINGKDGADGADGADGKDGQDGKDGVDGQNGSDGVDGKDGQNGADGKNGKNGTDGKDGLDGKDGVDGKDGIGIADIHIDEAGNLIFTLSDGSQLNAGNIPANAEQATQLAQAQANIAALEQEVQQQASYRTIAVCGLALAGASLLWQIIALILALTRTKKERRENSTVS